LLLYEGLQYTALIYLSGLIAAVLNYHRALWSWSGLPGVVGLYFWYMVAAWILRKRLHFDPRLRTLHDVGSYIITLLVAELFSSLTGMLTIVGDGYAPWSGAPRVFADWLASDLIAIFTVTPFLLIFACPGVHRWLQTDVRPTHVRRNSWTDLAGLETIGQAGSAILTIWLVFACPAAIPYQPLYLLFITVAWVAVRRGLPGATFATFTIMLGMTAVAGIAQSRSGSLPQVQLALITLGVMGLCLGALVSEHSFTEKELRRSEVGLKEAQRVARLGSWTLDRSTGKVTWSREFYEMLGFNSGLPFPDLGQQERLFTPEGWERLTSELENSQRLGTSWEMELDVIRPDGQKGWILVRGKPQCDAHGSTLGLCGIAQDITERKIAEERVAFLAYYDGLTGLPNRALLQDRLLKALASARRNGDLVAVLFLDLDRFKIINDSLGHSAGDALLRDVANRLNECAREQDTIARVGGDEFIIVVTQVASATNAAAVAERIVSSMCEEFVIQERSLNVRCSVGISLFPEHGTDSETLIKNADAAMYNAKDAGRNTFRFFTEELNVQVVERLMIENDLRRAIDRHELFLMYQPQVELATRKLIGLEALIRWQHPQLGLVPPDKFIRIAEQTGLIIPIGEWVLRTVCAQARYWQNRDLDAVSIAVNVSALQFRQDGFSALIRKILAETPLEAKYLELELTESILVTNADIMRLLVNELTAMGVRLSIDDFGTGYSNLSYLRQFPVSKLKIDRSFIRDVAINDDAAAIASAIINMAKSLNRMVIAEGVENEAQIEFLREHNCDELQGYYFSKPLLPAQVEDILVKREALTLGEHTSTPCIQSQD
jgi:diguanylate cyclase (GGDEF)-like protein/PAS domain S-box-containing protein